MGPFWSGQDPAGPNVGPMNFCFLGVQRGCGMGHILQGQSLLPICIITRVYEILCYIETIEDGPTLL